MREWGGEGQGATDPERVVRRTRAERTRGEASPAQAQASRRGAGPRLLARRGSSRRREVLSAQRLCTLLILV